MQPRSIRLTPSSRARLNSLTASPRGGCEHRAPGDVECIRVQAAPFDRSRSAQRHREYPQAHHDVANDRMISASHGLPAASTGHAVRLDKHAAARIVLRPAIISSLWAHGRHRFFPAVAACPDRPTRPPRCLCDAKLFAPRSGVPAGLFVRCRLDPAGSSPCRSRNLMPSATSGWRRRPW